MRVWALGCFYSHISNNNNGQSNPNLSEGADRVGGQLRGDKECPFSGVTKSGRVWRKVPESDARSVRPSLMWSDRSDVNGVAATCGPNGWCVSAFRYYCCVTTGQSVLPLQNTPQTAHVVPLEILYSVRHSRCMTIIQYIVLLRMNLN